jgi:hypothetical protein
MELLASSRTQAPLVVALALLAGCYAPEVSDCTVACERIEDCVDGQVCGDVGLCAAPDVACAPPIGEVQIAIEGDGKVANDNIGACDTRSTPDGICTFSLEQHRSYELKAIESNDRRFVTWTSTCAGDALTCVFVPLSPLTRVGAKFQWLD